MNTTDPNSKEALAKIFREYNGTNNNRANPLWGSKDVPLERRAPNSYHFNETTGRFEVRQDLPNPRNISNIAGNLVGNPVRSRLNVTMAFVIWGQFLDHDIDITEASEDEHLDITLPPRDPFFTTTGTLSFTRARFLRELSNSLRVYPNEITGWIDGSNVYGSNE